MNLTYKALTAAYSSVCLGARGPVLMALNPVRKPELVELFVQVHYDDGQLRQIHNRDWYLYKGMMVIFSPDVDHSTVRFWFANAPRVRHPITGEELKQSLMEEIQIAR